MYGCLKYNTDETPVKVGWPVHSTVSEDFFAVRQLLSTYLNLTATACLLASQMTITCTRYKL